VLGDDGGERRVARDARICPLGREPARAAGVGAGNVASQRIVDVVLGALALADRARRALAP
jgi:hypothetical protein